MSALEALGVSDLTAEAAERTKGFVLKSSEDLEAMAGTNVTGHHHHCGACGHGEQK